jgi:hypothetical protein
MPRTRQTNRRGIPWRGVCAASRQLGRRKTESNQPRSSEQRRPSRGSVVAFRRRSREGEITDAANRFSENV